MHRRLIAMLVAARKEAGLKQAELADSLGEYQSFVARIESGQRRVDVVEFIRLSIALGLSPKDFLENLLAEEDGNRT